MNRQERREAATLSHKLRASIAQQREEIAKRRAAEFETIFKRNAEVRRAEREAL